VASLEGVQRHERFGRVFLPAVLSRAWLAVVRRGLCGGAVSAMGTTGLPAACGRAKMRFGIPIRLASKPCFQYAHYRFCVMTVTLLCLPPVYSVLDWCELMIQTFPRLGLVVVLEAEYSRWLEAQKALEQGDMRRIDNILDQAEGTYVSHNHSNHLNAKALHG
jgi:hypothetical protein